MGAHPKAFERANLLTVAFTLVDPNPLNFFGTGRFSLYWSFNYAESL